MINSDDILACFVAGNAFTIEYVCHIPLKQRCANEIHVLTILCSDWFRIQTLEDTLQPTVDLVLNMAMFIWLGAVCPWSTFVDGSVIPPQRLFLLGGLILLLRRLPSIYLLRRSIRQIKRKRDALFMGFFGPIGVSAIFYCGVGTTFLELFPDDDDGAGKLQASMKTIVWFLVTTSVVRVPQIRMKLGITCTAESTDEITQDHSRIVNSFRNVGPLPNPPCIEDHLSREHSASPHLTVLTRLGCVHRCFICSSLQPHQCRYHKHVRL
jgi:hypothetical protein